MAISSFAYNQYYYKIMDVRRMEMLDYHIRPVWDRTEESRTMSEEFGFGRFSTIVLFWFHEITDNQRLVAYLDNIAQQVGELGENSRLRFASVGIGDWEVLRPIIYMVNGDCRWPSLEHYGMEYNVGRILLTQMRHHLYHSTIQMGTAVSFGSFMFARIHVGGETWDLNSDSILVEWLSDDAGDQDEES